MSIDEILRTSMEQLARDIEPTVADPAAVRSRVNRSRRVRSVAAIALAAAVVVGAVLGVTELRDHNDSAPLPPSTRNVDVAALWMSDGVLHIGDQAFPQDKDIATALARVESGAVYGASDGSIVYQPIAGPAKVIEDTAREDLPEDFSWGPAADPDSDVVAWLSWSEPDGRHDLWLYDVRRERVFAAGPVGDQPLSGDDNAYGSEPLTPIEWVGRNPEGGYTVLITKEGGAISRYDLRSNGGGTLRPFSAAMHDVTPDVLAEAGDGRQIRFTTPAGAEISRVEGVEADGGLSHDGAYYAGHTANPEAGGAIAVVDTQTGKPRYLDAPDGFVVRGLSWASGHTLMLRATSADGESTSGSVLACDADTLRCLDVAHVDDVITTILPRL